MLGFDKANYHSYHYCQDDTGESTIGRSSQELLHQVADGQLEVRWLKRGDAICIGLSLSRRRNELEAVGSHSNSYFGEPGGLEPFLQSGRIDRYVGITNVQFPTCGSLDVVGTNEDSAAT
jgi:hypothetical protein